MRALLHLKPGQKGTKKLCMQYGDRLVCVRYRYDSEQHKRFKTIELIIDERDWYPSPRRPKAHTIVGIQVGLSETEVRRQVKRAGGKWNHARHLWEMRYDQVMTLGLAGRIVKDNSI